jgi:hypothetical protein
MSGVPLNAGLMLAHLAEIVTIPNPPPSQEQQAFTPAPFQAAAPPAPPPFTAETAGSIANVTPPAKK